MDPRLPAWAAAVKRRRRDRLPTIWLFTDSARLPDPLALLPALPKRLCGIVLRQASAAFARRLAVCCRARGIALVLGEGIILPAHLGAGRHLRDGGRHHLRRPPGLLTAAAHHVPALRRAARAGADIIFLSPAFATASHPAAPGLGPLRWNRLAAQVRHRFHHPAICALGGVDGASIRRLGRAAAGAGGISMFFYRTDRQIPPDH